jgi:IMP dehydrogenase
VKRSEAGMVDQPDHHHRGRHHRRGRRDVWHVPDLGLPVVDDQGHLVGIITNRDMRFEDDPNRRSARS